MGRVKKVIGISSRRIVIIFFLVFPLYIVFHQIYPNYVPAPKEVT